MKKLYAVRIDEELLKKLKVMCAIDGITLQEAFEKMVKQYLKKMKNNAGR